MCACVYIYACVLSHFSCVQLYATLWIVAHQTPLSTGFPRQEYGVGCHSLLQGIIPIQGSSSSFSHFLQWQAGSLPLGPPGKPVGVCVCLCVGKTILYRVSQRVFLGFSLASYKNLNQLFG